MKASAEEIGRMLKDFDEMDVVDYKRPEDKHLDILLDYFLELSEADVGDILCMIGRGR